MIPQLKKALKEVFGDFLGENANQILDRSVWEGDPYGWSPGAVATISTEHGLPSGSYDVWAVEKWFEVSDLLPSDHFCETINGGVVAVHAG